MDRGRWLCRVGAMDRRRWLCRVGAMDHGRCTQLEILCYSHGGGYKPTNFSGTGSSRSSWNRAVKLVTVTVVSTTNIEH